MIHCLSSIYYLFHPSFSSSFLSVVVIVLEAYGCDYSASSCSENEGVFILEGRTHVAAGNSGIDFQMRFA